MFSLQFLSLSTPAENLGFKSRGKVNYAYIRSKRQIIPRNKEVSPNSTMCLILGISRQAYYYQPKHKNNETDSEGAFEVEFKQSRKNYRTRKIKKELEKTGVILN